MIFEFNNIDPTRQHAVVCNWPETTGATFTRALLNLFDGSVKKEMDVVCSAV